MSGDDLAELINALSPPVPSVRQQLERQELRDRLKRLGIPLGDAHARRAADHPGGCPSPDHRRPDAVLSPLQTEPSRSKR